MDCLVNNSFVFSCFEQNMHIVQYIYCVPHLHQTCSLHTRTHTHAHAHTHTHTHTAPHPPSCNLHTNCVITNSPPGEVLRVFLCSDGALHYTPEGPISHPADSTTTCATELDSGVGGIQPAKWQPFVAEGSEETALPYHSVRGGRREGRGGGGMEGSG